MGTPNDRYNGHPQDMGGYDDYGDRRDNRDRYDDRSPPRGDDRYRNNPHQYDDNNNRSHNMADSYWHEAGGGRGGAGGPSGPQSSGGHYRPDYYSDRGQV